MPDTPCHGGGVRVLLVEDEARMAAALARGLRPRASSSTSSADGPAGLEAARFGGYDAVVLDIMLPGMSGYTVVRTLRAEQNWVPVLLLTAKDGEYDQADGLDYGADDYLTKPFSFVVLLARLRALLRRDAGAARHGRSRPPAPHARPGRAPGRGRRRGGRAGPPRVPPARAPHARPPGRRRPRSRLLDDVWGTPRTSDANVVEVYIGYLRRKLGRDADRDRARRRLPDGA